MPLILPSGQSLPDNCYFVPASFLETAQNQPPAKKIALSESNPIAFLESLRSTSIEELSESESTEDSPNTPTEPVVSPEGSSRLWCTKSGCKQSFKSQEEADIHWESWHNLPCGLCSERLNAVDFVEHYEVFHDLKTNYPCKLCPGGVQLLTFSIFFGFQPSKGQKVYPSMDHYKKHYKTLHIKSKCRDCGEVFESYKRCKEHRDLVHRQIRFECDQCDKWYTKKYRLNVHIKNVHETGEFPCDECDAVCTSETYLYTHKYQKHRKPEMEKTIQCDQCDRKFSLQSELKAHIRTGISSQ